jgi:organic radical activating enzyme
MKNKLCVVYQLFTKCNIGCKYCYNYFEQDVLPFDYYTSKIDKILELYGEDTGFVLNGGEPLLLKGFNLLVNQATAKAKTFTYSNGTLSRLHYKRFIDSLEHKDNLYFTISIHFKEILRDDRLTDKYLKTIDMFAEHISNFKVNLIVDEEFTGEYLAVIRQAMRDVKEHTSLKYLNVLIADHMYNDELKLIRHLDQDFCDLIAELDENFTYKNCLWDNTRKTLTDMVNEVKENAKLKLTGKEFNIPYEYEFAQIFFLESPDGMVVEEFLGEERQHHVIPYDQFDTFVEDIKLKVQSKPLRKIKKLSSIGVI